MSDKLLVIKETEKYTALTIGVPGKRAFRTIERTPPPTAKASTDRPQARAIRLPAMFLLKTSARRGSAIFCSMQPFALPRPWVDRVSHVEKSDVALQRVWAYVYLHYCEVNLCSGLLRLFWGRTGVACTPAETTGLPLEKPIFSETQENAYCGSPPLRYCNDAQELAKPWLCIMTEIHRSRVIEKLATASGSSGSEQLYLL